MTKVILIRHAQTSWNRSRRIQGGNNDTVLDEDGEQQCHCLAQRLKKENIAAIYSSPLSRAMVTAQWIADGLDLDVIEEPAFREMNCGTLEGAEISDIGSRLQKLVNGGNEDEPLFKCLSSYPRRETACFRPQTRQPIMSQTNRLLSN